MQLDHFRRGLKPATKIIALGQPVDACLSLAHAGVARQESGMTVTVRVSRPRRSVLYVPAGNEKALAKVHGLGADSVIFDLEDSVAPGAKETARENLRRLFKTLPENRPETVIRVNPLAGEWGTEDLLAAVACRPDAILVPKINTARDIHDVDDALDETDAPEETKLWIMIETPKAMLNLGALAEFGRDPAARLACFVAGTNDLAKETRLPADPSRRYLSHWLMQIVLAARAGGLDVLDGTFNDFRDADGFARECAEAAAMGFDGKTLIHPSQIEIANQAFSPSPEALAEAGKITAAFALRENAGKGVIGLDGRMIERLHLAEAQALIEKARLIDQEQKA